MTGVQTCALPIYEDQLEYFMHLLNPDPYAPFKSKVLNCDDNPNCVNSYASKIQNEDKVIFDGNITALNQSKIKLPNFEDYIKADYNKSDGMEWILDEYIKGMIDSTKKDENDLDWIDEELTKFDGKISTTGDDVISTFDKALIEFNTSLKQLEKSKNIILTEVLSDWRRQSDRNYSLKELTKAKLQAEENNNLLNKELNAYKEEQDKLNNRISFLNEVNNKLNKDLISKSNTPATGFQIIKMKDQIKELEQDNSALYEGLNNYINQTRTLEDEIRFLKSKLESGKDDIEKTAFLALLLKNIYHAIKEEGACACTVLDYLDNNTQHYM